jgi:hypothetical protein
MPRWLLLLRDFVPIRGHRFQSDIIGQIFDFPALSEQLSHGTSSGIVCGLANGSFRACAAALLTFRSDDTAAD